MIVCLSSASCRLYYNLQSPMAMTTALTGHSIVGLSSSTATGRQLNSLASQHQLVSPRAIFCLPSQRTLRTLRARQNKAATHVASAIPVSDLALAASIPSLLTSAFRVLSAGFLLYSSLQWASARSDRKQVSQKWSAGTLHNLATSPYSNE